MRMNKSYIIYGLALLILAIIFFQGNEQEKLRYTTINATDMFLEENVSYKSTKNNNFNNNSLKDSITLVFFGYSSCPDFCPDTLAKTNQLFESLKEDGLYEDVQLLFVSVDPKDNLDIIKKYIEYFNKDFIGLSLSEVALKQLTSKTGVYYKKVSSTGDIDFYDHTGALFVVGRDAKIIGLYTPPLLNKDIYHDIKRIANR